MKDKTRTLIFDIETSPNLSYTWGKYQQDVIDFESQWDMLCFAWKWHGEKRIYAASQLSEGSEENLVKKLWELFDEADVIIAHNGDWFDIKKSNAKFVEYGLNAPSFYKTIDTKKVARKYFNFNSNKLNDIAKLLNLGQKTQTGGFDLWLGCMKNNKSSWKKMVEYNKNDVQLLEDVYLKLRPFMIGHPNSNLYNGTTHNCPTCNSANVQKRGFRHTTVGSRQAYQCKDCGSWSQGEMVKRNDKVVLR